ncbi:hypothetical protein RJ640_008022 [Escallonia rubra]|uniref:Sulfotransferase n=1 Tax=Escallonia rubra TaxID=112253 RepID=A0AA88QT42_9ASTE|nr:hypothetical protein RJ640_008022 [Escallonia rubra]
MLEMYEVLTQPQGLTHIPRKLDFDRCISSLQHYKYQLTLVGQCGDRGCKVEDLRALSPECSVAGVLCRRRAPSQTRRSAMSPEGSVADTQQCYVAGGLRRRSAMSPEGSSQECYYEDMKEQPRLHLRRLADFMRCPFSAKEETEGVVDEILALCSFDNLINLEENKDGKLSSGIENSAFFRRGEVGDWKNYLTADMGDPLDKIIEENLYGSGLKLRYQLTLVGKRGDIESKMWRNKWWLLCIVLGPKLQEVVARVRGLGRFEARNAFDIFWNIFLLHWCNN